MKVLAVGMAVMLTGCASMMGAPDMTPVTQAVKDNPNGSVVCATWAGGKIVTISMDKGTAPRNGSVSVGDGCNVTFTNGSAR